MILTRTWMAKERLSGTRSPTGEPDFLFQRHLATYLFAQRFTVEKTVLDVGCGEGYGAAVLSENSNLIYVMDLSKASIHHARLRHGTIKRAFIAADATTLPLREKVFDVIVSLQVIEHVNEVSTYLSEIHRVLKPRGSFILSTPNKGMRLRVGQSPWNPDHIREFDANELRATLESCFNYVRLCRLHGSEGLGMNLNSMSLVL